MHNIKSHFIGPCEGVIPKNAKANNRSPCMDDNGKCTKGFPKFKCKDQICDCFKHTIHGEETYPIYQRRCCKTLGSEEEFEDKNIRSGLGFTTIKCRYLGGVDYTMDNR